jgi:hypothetical protein
MAEAQLNSDLLVNKNTDKKISLFYFSPCGVLSCGRTECLKVANIYRDSHVNGLHILFIYLMILSVAQATQRRIGG